MDDRRIVSLFWLREERAITEAARKYGSYLNRIAWGILHDPQDAQECVNDAYCAAWNAIPPNRPERLSAFLGKLTRRIAIDRLRSRAAAKRGGGELPLALEELEDCVSGADGPEEAYLRRERIARLNGFLAALPATERQIFLRRYWYLEPVREIAARFGFSESKVTSMLYRTRMKLKSEFEKEDE